MSCLNYVSVNQTKWSNQGWFIPFRRNLSDCEIGDILSLLGLLNSLSSLNSLQDSLSWKHKNSGIFYVKNYSTILTTSTPALIFWPWKSIWKNKAPYKVKYFPG
uniref:Putative ovule protein n=1 Tax=Solanum chacoense TaxID=4108 RepID=A0A0V0GQH2_SOLCH